MQSRHLIHFLLAVRPFFIPQDEFLNLAGGSFRKVAELYCCGGFEAGDVRVRTDGDLTFITGRPEWAPEFDHIQLESPAEVDALKGPPDGHDLAGAWAWEDEAAGRVRVRVFPVRFGIEEDEATGAHAVRMAALLDRPLTINQGEGSVIVAEPQPDGSVEIGGRTELVETREYPS